MMSRLFPSVTVSTSPVSTRRQRLLAASLLVAGALLVQPVVVQAQQATKIGFVSTDRILRDSKPAVAAQSKIEAEFKKRDDELTRLANSLHSQAQRFDKDAPTLSENERIKRQRQLTDLDADLQRKRREFQEDFNRRRNEEFTRIVEQADAAIKKIAESQGYDLIIQDAVTVSPRVDITEQVLKALGG